jgi:hypothetical protein
MYQKEFIEYQDTDVVTKRRIELQTFHEAGLTLCTDSKNCGSIRAKIDLDVTLLPISDTTNDAQI